MLELRKIRELALEQPSAPGRPAHLSAASGLVIVQSLLYVVADDELSLAVFPGAGEAPGKLVRYMDGELPVTKRERKKHKPDLESLVLLPPFRSYPHGALFAMGSGSRSNRRQGVIFALDAQGAIQGAARLIDLSPLLTAVGEKVVDLNIEGALWVQDRFMLLQRGNKGDGRNAVITLDLSDVLHVLASGDSVPPMPFETRYYDLGDIDGVPLTFTDGAALSDGRIVFTAVAENVADSYADGACLGATAGILSSDGVLQSLDRLDPGVKVEGLDAHLEGGRIALTMVSDADDAAIPASLYQARL
jgi:hypothetical protein